MPCIKSTLQDIPKNDTMEELDDYEWVYDQLRSDDVNEFREQKESRNCVSIMAQAALLTPRAQRPVRPRLSSAGVA